MTGHDRGLPLAGAADHRHYSRDVEKEPPWGVDEVGPRVCAMAVQVWGERDE